jgi:hypothetical protein
VATAGTAHLFITVLVRGELYKVMRVNTHKIAEKRTGKNDGEQANAHDHAHNGVG